MTAGPEDGSGAARAMTAALTQAGVSPDQVQHLNAHATSTPVGDKGELEAIKGVFGRGSKSRGDVRRSPRSATCSARPAASKPSSRLWRCATRLRLPRWNLEDPDSAADGVDIVAGAARPMAMEFAIVERLRVRRSGTLACFFRRWEGIDGTAKCQVLSAKCQVS
jgi:3-oxoacyl-[acyl-carrier-protein] synthase II